MKYDSGWDTELVLDYKILLLLHMDSLSASRSPLGVIDLALQIEVLIDLAKDTAGPRFQTLEGCLASS